MPASDASFSLEECQLVAVFMTSVAYGVYLVTLGMCVRTLFWPQSGEHRASVNRPLAVATVLMAIFATFEAAFTLRFALDGFIYRNGPGGPTAVFKNVSSWVNVMKTTDVQVMTFIGDGILIHRCFVIYARSWRVIAGPFVLWVGNGVCGILQIWRTATASKTAGQTVLGDYVTAFFVITVVTNILVTGLIVLRIWRIDKASAKHSAGYRRPTLKHISLVLVESGLLYTATAVIALAVHLAGSNAITPMADIMVEIIGISFNLIIVRVNRGIAVGDVCDHNSGRDNAGCVYASPFPMGPMRAGGNSALEITVSTQVDCSPPYGTESERRDSWVKGSGMIV